MDFDEEFATLQHRMKRAITSTSLDTTAKYHHIPLVSSLMVGGALFSINSVPVQQVMRMNARSSLRNTRGLCRLVTGVTQSAVCIMCVHVCAAHTYGQTGARRQLNADELNK